ncbi:iron-sulfur cluster carrier protein ApbC [Steroidobacter sp. S1-65]|uniref:Iron-sulfur cluster carrier protein n=1 Tax=Steroidobacter gossypii TaxID=2805490 RepID=A0ABS1X655_9GAMM|nr:iron-sulfur cluster carrier protein ApbC [Steroidobacter gossypii]MBM0108712.1 iron-sulfur cluster carrier protein ApbC [Steroidobacter gossypii]
MSSDTTLHETELRQLLGSYEDPYLGLTLERAGSLKIVRLADGDAAVSVELGFPARQYAAELSAELERRARSLNWLKQVKIDVNWRVDSHTVQNNLKPIQGIRNIIAVASGKGGVGKSTTAANLALALAHEGAAVGLLDADIYGPSQPQMMGLSQEKPTSPDQRTMIAPEAFGLKVMSIGFLVDVEQPMVWRGPMVTQALVQLLETTRWGELDYLVVDMPPGTGDTQLTLSQRVPVSGAVIVTTPQDIALLDARKGLRMFQKVAVPVLGVVENMSTHVCSNCGFEEHIFGAGGGRRMAEQYGVELLGELPLDIRIREQADSGRPTVAAEPDSKLGRAYIDFARRTAARLVVAGLQPTAAFPNISTEDT